MKLIIEEGDKHQRIAVGTYPIEGHIEGSCFVSASIGQREVPKGFVLDIQKGPPNYEKARHIVAYLNSIYSQIPLAPEKLESWDDPIAAVRASIKKIMGDNPPSIISPGAVHERCAVALAQALTDRGCRPHNYDSWIKRTSRECNATGYNDVDLWAGVRVKNFLAHQVHPDKEFAQKTGGFVKQTVLPYDRACKFDLSQIDYNPGVSCKPNTQADARVAGRRAELVIEMDDSWCWEATVGNVIQVKECGAVYRIPNVGDFFTGRPGELPDGSYIVTKVERAPKMCGNKVTLQHTIEVRNQVMYAPEKMRGLDRIIMDDLESDTADDPSERAAARKWLSESMPYRADLKRAEDERTEGDDMMEFFRN